MKGNTQFGTYTGTGAGGIDIPLGFYPDKIEIVNVTDNNLKAEHYVGVHASGTSFDTTATGAVNNAAGSIVPSQGVRATSPAGFNTGADNNVAAKVYAWTATARDAA